MTFLLQDKDVATEVLSAFATPGPKQAPGEAAVVNSLTLLSSISTLCCLRENASVSELAELIFDIHDIGDASR